MVVKNQGEDIEFMLTFSQGIDENITSFDDVDEVIAYVYTNKFMPAKFSDTIRLGYYGMLKVDSTHRAGLLPASFTRKMQVGDLFVEVMTVKDGRRSVGVTYETGVHLDPAKIKEEV